MVVRCWAECAILAMSMCLMVSSLSGITVTARPPNEDLFFMLCFHFCKHYDTYNSNNSLFGFNGKYSLQMLNPLFCCPGRPHHVDVMFALVEPPANCIRGSSILAVCSGLGVLDVGVGSLVLSLPACLSTA